MSALIIFHVNLQSFSFLLKRDLRLKLEYYYRILLKKYSCVRVSISNMGFSWHLECWKEGEMWKQGEICFSHKIQAIVFRRQRIHKKAKHIYFCLITRAVTFWLLKLVSSYIALELYFCPVAGTKWKNTSYSWFDY